MRCIKRSWKRLISMVMVLLMLAGTLPASALALESTEEHTHTWDEGTVVTPASCTEGGVVRYACACGETRTEDTAPAGHSWGEWTVLKDPTCTETGSRKHSCTVCGEEVTETTPANGHSWGEWTVLKDPTCTETGSREHICTVCGEKVTETTPANGHSWGEWTVLKDPACTETGSRVHTCTVCGEEVTEAVPAKGHTWGDWAELKAPTCTEEGEHEHTCTVCGEKASEPVPAKGHTWGDWTELKAPTCTEEGEHEHTCTVCGEKASEAVSAKGHTWGDWTVLKKPTCTEKGEQEHTCTVCGVKEKEEMPAKGHTWSEDNGVDLVYCTVCRELKIIADGGSFDTEFDEESWIIAGDQTADVEDETSWAAMFRDIVLTGDWAEDLLTIAQTQMGYHESTANYAVNKKLERNGYTRYGAWWGLPYGDWCAMFISFCLRYAEISEEAMPRQAACAAWVDALKEKDMFRLPADYTPCPGDLIFYDKNGDGKSEHVGIVNALDAGTGMLYTIEGNLSDMVGSRKVGRYDNIVLGFGVLPENPEKKTETEPARAQRTLRAELNGQTVTVSGLLPTDAELVIAAVSLDKAAEIYEKQTGEKTAPDGILFAFDVVITSGGKKYDLASFGDGISVKVTNTSAENAESVNVLHVKVDVTDDEGKLDEDKLDSLRTDQAAFESFEAKKEGSEVFFDLTSLSLLIANAQKNGDCSDSDEAQIGEYLVNWSFKWVGGNSGSTVNYEYKNPVTGEADPNYLFMHPQDFTTQKAILAVEVTFTGTQDDSVPAGSVEIRIPLSVFTAWNGTTGIDQIVSQIPRAPATNGESFYNWTVDEAAQEIVIRNWNEITGNDYLYAEFSYQVHPMDVPGGSPDEEAAVAAGFTEPSYGMEVETGGSDIDRFCWNHNGSYLWKDYYTNEGINCTITIDPNRDGTPDYYDYDYPLSLAMMTRAGGSLRARHQPDPRAGVYTAWQRTWGAEPEDADDYVYVIWDVRYRRLNAMGDTQPWNYEINYDDSYPAITFSAEGKEDKILYGTMVGSMLHTSPNASGTSYYATLWGGDNGRGYYTNLAVEGRTNKYIFGYSKYANTFRGSITGYMGLNGLYGSGTSTWDSVFWAILVRYPIDEIKQYAEEYGVDLENAGLTIQGQFLADETWESNYEIQRKARAEAKLFLVDRSGVGVYTKHKGGSPVTEGAQTALTMDYPVDLSNINFDGFNRYPYYMSYSGTSRVEDSKVLGQKIIITERQLMLSSAGAPNSKGWQPNSANPAQVPVGTGYDGDGNVFLTDEDYTIPRFDIIKMECYQAAAGAGQWTEGGLLPKDDYSPVYIYIRYAGTSDYVLYCAAVKASDTSNTPNVYRVDPSETDADGNPIIHKDKAHQISPVQYHYALPDGVTGIRYEFDTSDQVFRTALTVGMHVILKPTERVKAAVSADIEAKKETYVKNIADCDVYTVDGDGGETLWLDMDNCAGGSSVADDVIWRLTRVTNTMYVSKNVSVPKDDDPAQIAAGEKDVEMAYVRLMSENYADVNKNIANTTDMEDRYKLLQGTFFELLPKGTNIRTDSVFGVYNQTWSSHQYSAASYPDWVKYKDRGGKVNLDGSRYFLGTGDYSVSTEYIEALDQTLVRIDYSFEDPNCGLYPGTTTYSNMQFFFILENPYQNIRARGINTMNYMAFMNTREGSPSAPGGGYTITPGHLDKNQLIADLFLEKTAESEGRAGCNKINIPWNAVTVLEANYTKTVATPETLNGLPVQETYSSDGGTVTVGNRYIYRLQMTNLPTTRADSIVFYDILETGTDVEDSYWKGKFVSVDTSLIGNTPSDGSTTGARCKPVVYYSTTLTGKIAPETDFGDLKNEAIWTTTCPEDPSTVTAIAIDCTGTTVEGEDFHLGMKATLTAYIHMIAPLELPTPPDAPTVNGSVCYARPFTDTPGGINPEPSVLMSRAMLNLRDTNVELVKESDPKTGTPTARTIVDSDGFGTIVYRLTLRNNMPFDCNDIVVTDVIPEHLSLDKVTVKLNGSERETDGTATSGFRYELAEDGRSLTFYVDQQHPTVTETETGEDGSETVTVKTNKDTEIYIHTTVDELVEEETETVVDDEGNETETKVTRQVFLRDYDNTATLVSANGKTIDKDTDTTYHRAETTRIDVEKIWDDANDRYKLRPEQVTLTLGAWVKTGTDETDGDSGDGGDDGDTTEPGDGGEAQDDMEDVTDKLNVSIAPLVLTPDEDGFWKGSFENLPKYYVVTEDASFTEPNLWYEIEWRITEEAIYDPADTAEDRLPIYTPEYGEMKPAEGGGYETVVTNHYGLKYGSLEIVKLLKTYEDSEPATFVFDVVGTLGEGENARTVYSNVAVLTLSQAGTKSTTLHNIPAGCVVTVTERYTGSKYNLTSENGLTQTIVADETVSVNFDNDYGGNGRGGHGVVNMFSADGEGGWSWKKADSTPNEPLAVPDAKPEEGGEAR